MYAAPPPPPPQKKRFPTWLIVVLVIVGLIVISVPIFAVLATYGVRKYIANAKTTEARNSLGQIAKDVATAYEENHALCASASHPVPLNVASVRGMKYQSTVAEWQVDKARNAGFACLKFEMDAPQYYQYSYTATGDTFEVTAHGDLDGDGNVSTFKIRGNVTGGHLVIAPSIEEQDPEE